MAREVIFEEQSLPFTYSEGLGAYVYQETPCLFTLTIGETYVVVWDSTEHTLTAFAADAFAEGAVGLGNPAFIGGEADPENLEFIVGYVPSTDYAGFLTSQTDESHTIAIYQEVADETPTVPGVDIVLRDRNGNQIAYPGVNYIKVPTVDGGTQGYAAYDPDTLKPENLPVGITVGGVVGSRVIPEPVAATVEPDFSEGDMVVTPDTGKVFSGVTVTKPANLVPENIKKDEVVAGIVGTHEGGGEMKTPHIITYVAGKNFFTTTTTATNYTVTVSLPADAIVCGASGGYAYSQYSSSSSRNTGPGASSTPFWLNTENNQATVTSSDSAVTVSWTCKYTHPSNYSYGSRLLLVVVASFTLPGVNVTIYSDGYRKLTIERDDQPIHYLYSCDDWLINELDLRGCGYAYLGGKQWSLWKSVSVIRVPSAVKTVTDKFIDVPVKTLDFSLATSVPTLNYADAFPAKVDGFEILVPASLYDEWIAATNWSTLASYIVAV